MCGIIGVLPKKTKISDSIPRSAREASIRFLATQLLIGVEERGKDATGIAAHLAGQEWFVLKQPVAAKEFTVNTGQEKYSNQKTYHNYRSAMAAWRNCAENKSLTAACIGHARKGTKGSEYEDVNNHPILVENCIIGVHNGRIENDSRIFDIHKDLKRKGEVDSEAVFQLQYALSKDAPPSLDILQDMDSRLRGEYATLSINTRFPGVVAALRRGKPMDVGIVEKLGLILIASENKSIDEAIAAYNRMLISLAGVRLPYLSLSDISTVTIADYSAVVFNMNTDSDNLKDCIKTRDMGSRYISSSTAASQRKEYDVASTSGAVTVHHYGHSGGYTDWKSEGPRNRLADIEDETEYEAEENQTTASTVVSGLLPAHGVVASIRVAGPIQGISTQGNCTDEEAALRHDGEFDLEARRTSGMLWESGLKAENIHAKLGIPEHTNTIPSDVLAEIVETISDEVYPEGYVAGALAQSPTTDAGRAAEIGKSRARQKREGKVLAFIANMKTFVSAILCASDAIEFDDKHEVMSISPYLFAIARKINPAFDESSVYKMFGNDGDVERLAELCDTLSEPEMAEEDDASEEAEAEESDGVEELACLASQFAF